MFKTLTVDISENCGAKCPWCTTGKLNRSNNAKFIPYMTDKEFDKGMHYLLSLSAINNDTEIELYNWGEPLINPYIDNIIDIIKSYGNPYHISTNAYNIDNFKIKDFGKLTFLMVSLSAFSQRNYDKIHSLNLERVLTNIEILHKRLCDVGLGNRMQVNFHLYKFNMVEMIKAKEYFAQKNIKFVPRLAYFNDFYQMENFLSGNTDKTLKKAQAQIFCQLIRKIASDKPDNDSYRCPQIYDKLVFGANWDLIPCCRLSRKHVIGNLYDMTLDDILSTKSNYKLCGQCINSGQSYFVHNPLEIKLSVDNKYFF